MRQETETAKPTPESMVKDIRRRTRKHRSGTLALDPAWSGRASSACAATAKASAADALRLPWPRFSQQAHESLADDSPPSGRR